MRIVRRVRDAQVDVLGREKFTDAPAALAGERDDAHLALVRGVDGRDHVGRIARCRDREQHVALGAERPHLLGEHLLERIVVGDRRQQRRVGGQRDRRAAPAARARSGRRARRRNAARRQPSRRCRTRGSCRRRTGTRSSAPPARAIGAGHRFRSVVLQLRAVGEMSANALDVIDHCGRILAGCARCHSTSTTLRRQSMHAASRRCIRIASKRQAGSPRVRPR